MKPVRLMLGAALLCAIAAPDPAHAAGYQIYEQGSAVLGMAGAGTASVNDASALFFNPAALTRVDRTRFYIGSSILSPAVSFAGMPAYPGYGVTEEMNSQHFPLPTFYLTHRTASKWAVGFGVNTTYGLGVDWKNPDTYTGRYIVTKAKLTTINSTLSLAYELNPQWSVAAGGNVLLANVELHNRVQAVVPGGGGAVTDVAKADLEGDRTPGYGWNAALSFVPGTQWKLGAAYRSKVVVHEDGHADFTQILTGNAGFDAAVAASLPPDQNVSTVLRFPATWSAGIAFLPATDWTVEADVNYVEWKLFSDLPLYFKTTPSANQTIEENYDNTVQVRVGAEHRLTAFTYRFGYYFDQGAAPPESVSPLLPDADRHGATLGLGMRFGANKQWALDAYDLALFVNKRSTEGINRDGYDGEYKTFINSIGVTAELRW